MQVMQNDLCFFQTSLRKEPEIKAQISKAPKQLMLNMLHYNHVSH